MIVIENGRARSVRTAEETEKLLESDISRLSAAERETLKVILREMQGDIPEGEKSLLDLMGAAEYKTTPVDIRTFVKDPYFLGRTCNTIYPKLLDDLEQMFDGGYQEAVISGAIGVGKTFYASIGIARVLYEISCLKDPHASYGLAPGSNISIVTYSVNESLAKKVAFENIVTKIQESPYFKEQFPFEPTKEEFRFPNSIWLAPRATTPNSALGLNVIAAFIDEADFLSPKKNAQGIMESPIGDLYTQIRRRIKSRFDRQGRLPGMLFVVSSKKTSEDFTQRHLREAKTDSTVFALDYAAWHVKPEEYFSSNRFWVLCGNAEVGSKLLADDEVQKYKDNTPEGTILLDVPEDFRADFERNLEASIRDIGGISTVSVKPFIQRREKIKDAIDPVLFHPFSTEVYDLGKPGKFMWDRMVVNRRERAPGRIEFDRIRPKINPTAARHCHFDLGLRKDALGFCMSHVCGWKDVIRRGSDGVEFKERAPVYLVDLVLKMIPPAGGEIIFAEGRQLVYDLLQHGYMITCISFDSWQSVDSIQQFNAKGLNAQTISVDTDPLPYDTLKMALYEDRIKYYNYPLLIKELTELEEDFSGRKRKIDHPTHGSKDLGDALAGTIFTLSTQKLVQPLPIMRGVSYAPDTWMEEQRQSALAGNKNAGSQLLPFYMGNSNDPDPWGDI